VSVGLRVLVLGLAAWVAAVIALQAPVTSVNDYEVSALVYWPVLLVVLAGAMYLGLTRIAWRTRLAVFGALTVGFGLLFFATTDWHTRQDGPEWECLTSGPPYFSRFDYVKVQRIPPGVRCQNGEESFLVRPDTQDWLVLFGESAAAGFAATGPVLWLLRLPGRRRVLPGAIRPA
jgi:hypothetical protein